MKKIINKYLMFIKYFFSSGICFFFDLLLFTIFIAVFKNSSPKTCIIISTIFARILSSFLNYLLNKNIVFKKKGNEKVDGETLIKYYSLVVIQMLVSSFSVSYIYGLTAYNETLIKIPVEFILFIVNFFVQKLFIFNNNQKKEKSNIFLFILSIIVSVSLVYNPFKTDMLLKINLDSTFIINIFLTLFIYTFFKKFYNKVERRKSFKIISFIFTILLILGYSIDKTYSFSLVYSNIQYIVLSIVKLIGYYSLINLSLNLLYDYIEKINIKEKNSDNKFIVLFNKKTFLFSFCVIFIVYLVYLIAFYPGVVGYDPSYQIKEYMGLSNFYSDSINLIDPNVTITAFNPVIHTLLIGSLFKLGHVLGNDNFGIFIYSLIQLIACAATFSYSIKFLKDEKVSNKLLLILLGIYTLIPLFAFYSICAFKDTYFSLLFLLYVIQLYKLMKYEFNYKKIIIFIIISILLCLLRNNGILIILFSLPVCFFALKKQRKAIVIVLFSTFLVYFSYNTFFLDYFKITQTSVREVLSVPFQQTASLIVNNEKIIEEEDKKIIDKVLDYDFVKENYDPELSDKVKNTYNKDATDEDLARYFGVWYKYLLKDPKTYIEATTSNIYGYFYPNTRNWYFYYKKYGVLNEVGYDYHYIKCLSIFRTILSSIGIAYQFIPIVGTLANVGLICWIYIYLIGYLTIKKEKKYIILLIPMIAILLSCMVGPVNTYYRYVFPYSCSLPMILLLIYNNVTIKNKSN